MSEKVNYLRIYDKETAVAELFEVKRISDIKFNIYWI